VRMMYVHNILGLITTLAHAGYTPQDVCGLFYIGF
jgi:hypothetical protein